MIFYNYCTTGHILSICFAAVIRLHGLVFCIQFVCFSQEMEDAEEDLLPGFLSLELPSGDAGVFNNTDKEVSLVMF